MVLSPHPDDETLGAGGLIADLRRNGVDVTVIAVTDGENAYADTSGLGHIRKQEQEKALAMLGVSAAKIQRLQIVDSAVQAAEEKLRADVLPLIDHQTHVIAPWTGDFHPDHEAVGNVAAKIARECGATLTQYFFWTWHRGTLETIRHLGLKTYPLTAETLKIKQQALACHRSQLEHASGEPILPENLLAPMRRPFEVYLPV